MGRTALEISVQQTHAENEQLRKKLTTLLANRPNGSSSYTNDPLLDPTLAQPARQAGTGIDYAYLSKLQTELSSNKATLLEKEVELARLKGVDTNPELDALRQTLLGHNTQLTTLEAEAKSLESTISHLRSERDELAKQRATIQREVDMRRALKATGLPEQIHEQHGEKLAVETGDDRGLMDVSWMEVATKGWDQVSSASKEWADVKASGISVTGHIVEEAGPAGIADGER